METIGDRVRKLRTARHMSRETLARECGLKYSTIADLENGNMKSSTKLHLIAEALGVTANHLETGVPDEPPRGPVTLSKREQALIQAFRAASTDGKRAIEGAAAGVSSPFTTPQKATLRRSKTGS